MVDVKPIFDAMDARFRSDSTINSLERLTWTTVLPFMREAARTYRCDFEGSPEGVVVSFIVGLMRHAAQQCPLANGTLSRLTMKPMIPFPAPGGIAGIPAVSVAGCCATIAITFGILATAQFFGDDPIDWQPDKPFTDQLMAEFVETIRLRTAEAAEAERSQN